MFNGGRFNVLGFNANTVASLVIISASTTFDAGTTSIDFGEPGYAKRGTADIQAQLNTEFSGGSITKFGITDYTTSSNTYFEAVLDQVGNIQWQNQSALTAEPLLEAWANVAIEGNVSLTAYTDFRKGNIDFGIAGATLEAVGSPVEFITAALEARTSALTISEIPVDRRVIGNWLGTSDLWANPVHDEQLGYLRQDAYWFQKTHDEWTNINFLTATFTTGGFISGGAEVEFVPNKFVHPPVYMDTAVELVVEPSLEQVTSIDYAINVAFTADALRTAYVESDQWDLETSLVQRVHRVTVRHAVKHDFAITIDFDALGRIHRYGRVNLFVEHDLADIQAVRQRMGRLRLGTSSDTGPYESLKTAYTVMDLSGIAGSINAAGVLRLVDAPPSRRFEVPFAYRYFEVPNNNNDFEVPS